MRMTTTKDKGWQKLCWKWAEEGAAFQVADVIPRHIIFLQELCAAYKCKHKLVGRKIQLTFS